jgi:hypothetical protein
MPNRTRSIENDEGFEVKPVGYHPKTTTTNVEKLY